MASPKGLISLFLLVVTRISLVDASVPVTVGLRTSWPAHNLLLEILETAAIEQPSSFFPLVDLLTSPDAFPPTSSSFNGDAGSGGLASLTPEAIHEASLAILRQQGYIATLTPSEVKTESSKHINLKEFELALSLHVASPKLQGFYSFYEDWVLSKMEGVRGSTVDSEECFSWVDWYGARLCSSDDLKAVLSREALDAADKTAPPKKPKLLPFDHIYPDPGTTIFSPSRTAILYADITSSNFRDLHEALLKHATSLPPKLQYVFRYVTPPKLSNGIETKKQFLTGYGVGLDLKKTDYLVVDDRRAARSDSDAKDVIAEEESDNGPELVRLLLDALPPSQSGEPVNLTAPLNKEEYKYLGVQATQLILNSESPIDTLAEISENFPLYATEIARKVEIQGDLQYEMAINARRVPRSVTMGWLNGKAMDNINDLNAFSILNMLRAERPHMQALTSLGLNSAQALQVLTGEAVAESFNQGSMFDGIFDASDRQEGGEVIMWLNDIEKDERYSRWPKNIDQILMPIYPGSFHSIRINLWNIVLGVDLSNRESLIWIFKHVSNIIERKFPFRWGIAPLTDTPEAEKAARIFYYVQKHYGPKETMDFIRSLIAAQQERDTIDFLVANAFFNNLGINVKPLLELELDSSVSHDYDVVVEGQEPHAIEKLENAKKWAERLDVKIPKNELGHVFLNGRHYPLDSNFLMSLQRDAGSQTSYIQNELQTGKLSSGPEVDWSTYFYDLPSTPKRRNRYLFPDPETSPLQVKRLDVLFRNAGYEYPYRDLLNPVETDPPTPLLVTLWIVGDLDAPETMEMAIGAIKALEKHKDFRLGFIHAPKILPMSDATSAPRHSALLQQLSGHFGGLSPSQLLEALETSTPGRVNPLEYLDFCMSGQILAREIGLRPGQMGVIVNGRIIGPLPAGAFSEVDFPPLIVYERDRRVTPIITALKEAQFATESLDRSSYADLISTAASVIAAVQVPDPTAEGLFNIPMRPRQRQYRHLDSKHSKIAHGKEDTALFHFAFVVDPLSEAAQKLGGLLKWLSTLETVYLEVYMIADQTREELPLKRFYRSLVRPHLIFNEAGDEVPPMVGFKNLPEEPIYTLAMDVPASWLARPRESEYDLDNIHLASLSGSERITGVKALFDLDFLVIEGHARDTSTGSPPRGLQLQLISHDMTPIADTLVVENLGYLQFKAKPGVFQLDIKKGRGEDVFVTESVGNAGWESPPVESEAGAEVTLTSFEGLTLYPRFKRQQGQADTDVLRPPRENFFSSAVQKVVQAVTSWIRPPEVVEEADINIFTVASGHLYERFASIMILSVMKNTNSTVKFWFIENFLSPSFLEFIPHLAEEYNFQYELVTYKWPSWLRSQREKQRVIWGYKILFLDVLFPMDLKKVIFVDADQIVRTDLQELVDLDLHGAPYGYTPMGDDNADMEGFRFWKTGYWKDYLKGRPYHISALYVIDLVKFRQLAAGDRLRGHYQQLSADPNSLANLDQDLPNNMQFEVPIFSLDKNWLWCETWCSKDRLDQAKTIDLCQNPLTKEPKLSRARQIPEWSKYDGEIAGFARRLVKEGKIGSSALSAEVDALAGEKPKKGTGTADDSAAPVEGETTASSSPVHAEL